MRLRRVSSTLANEPRPITCGIHAVSTRYPRGVHPVLTRCSCGCPRGDSTRWVRTRVAHGEYSRGTQSTHKGYCEYSRGTRYSTHRTCSSSNDSRPTYESCRVLTRGTVSTHGVLGSVPNLQQLERLEADVRVLALADRARPLRDELLRLGLRAPTVLVWVPRE